MSDSPAGSGPAGLPEPDFLDRLIARHTAGAVPGAARVRPRLPGPFERVEAVRDRVALDEDALLWPSATPSAVPPPELTRPATVETRTYRERERTVVRTERTPEQLVPPPAPVVRVVAPSLRPAAPLAPGPRPVPDAGRRASGRGRAERGPSQTAASVPIPPGAPAVPTQPRPSAADTAAARDAVRQAAARRSARVTEQVVQVQIGRLEVTAGGAPSGSTRQRTPTTGRAGATVSLAEYLARGRE